MKRIKDWEELTIQDNFLFQKVMRNKRLCQYLIEKILQIKMVNCKLNLNNHNQETHSLA